MLKSIAKKITSLVPLRLIERSVLAKFGYVILAYSQHGEDAILKDLLTGVKTGFYVDVGAHHPTRFSNTFWFYRRGWRGINIDATPGSMDLFNKIRSRDINVEMAVSNSKRVSEFHVFQKTAFNTLSGETATQHENSGNIKSKVVDVLSATLSDILDKNLVLGQQIDFLSIDVEGSELEVLRSNDWNKYVPRILVVEDIQSDLEKLPNSQIFNFVKEKGYDLVAYAGKTMIFIRSKH